MQEAFKEGVHGNMISNMEDIHKLLENDFWADSSDDEGIGSDESLDLSDQYVSDGSERSSDPKGAIQRISLQPSQRTGRITNSCKQNGSVLNLGKFLVRSIKSKEKCEPVQISQIKSRKVFAVDLVEHLEQSSAMVPDILKYCSEIIEKHGVTDGIYRLSGQSCNIARLKQLFQEGKSPSKDDDKDPHSVASLLKVSFASKCRKNESYFSFTSDFFQTRFFPFHSTKSS